MTVVQGLRGGVASGHPRAADAGMRALDAGGSCVDAVLTMAFAQWVVSGPLCGPGGDLFVLHVEDDRAFVHAGWSRTPKRFPPQGPVESAGPKAAVVPGALAGAERAWEEGGRLPWPELFDDAVALSEGHEATAWMARSYASVVERGHEEAFSRFLDQSRLPEPGDVVSCRRLGDTLRQLAEHGAAAFYQGGVAQQLAAAAEADGAYLAADDLSAMRGETVPAVVEDVADMTVAYPPPPSQSRIAARLLAAAPTDVAAESPAYATLVAPVTRDELIERCVVGMPGTAVSVAADGRGAAAVVHSLAGVQFGSGWVAGETGIALGNRVGTALSVRADLAAAQPVPGGLLPHTLSAAWFRSDTRWALVATPGGDRQVQWLAQSGQRFRRGESLERIVSGPRWFVCPEGDRFGVPGGIGQEWFLFAEPEIEWADEEQLASFTVRRTDSVGGGLQGVEHRDGRWQFGSDSRAGGIARAQGGQDV